MAATVTGAFVVLDRASRPIRKIRDEAIEADLAVKSLGSNLDKIGTRQQRQMMGNTASQIRSLGGESDAAAQEADVLAKRLEHVGAPQIARNITTNSSAIRNTSRAAREGEPPVRRLGDGLRRVGDESERSRKRMGGLGKALGMVRSPMLLLIPLIGSAATAISALGAGVVELLPKLGQLSALAAPAGTAVMGVGLAAITAKLAFSDLSKAMAGNAKAMQALTPEGKQFLTTLRQYRPVLQELRQSAQRGLFPGLDVALRKLNAATPVARSMLQGMGQRLGNLASNAASQITTPGFLRDFETIGNEAMHTVTRLGEGVLNLAQAFRHFLVAGLPFTHWLTETVFGWTKHIEVMAQAGRETGRLSTFFMHAQQSLTVFGHIAHNVFTFVHGVLHAASGESDYLYSSIEKTTARWAAWASSAHGQSDMRAYFVSMREPLHQVVGFVGDLVKGIASMVDAPTFTNMMGTLRQSIPGLAQGLKDITANFGPVLIGALGQIITLFSTIAGNGGPLSTMLRMLTGVLGTVNSLVKAVPGLGTIMGVAFAVLGTRAMMSKMGLIDGLGGRLAGLAGRWRGVAAAANGAAAAEERAATVGAVAGVGAGAGPMVSPLLMGRQVRGAPSYQAASRMEADAGAGAGFQQLALFGGASAAGTAGRAMFGRTAMAQVEGDAALSARSLESMGFGGRLASARLTAAAALAAGRGAAPSMAMGAARSVGRFAAPLLLFQGAAGALSTPGGLSDRLQGGVSSATFGVVPAPLSNDQLTQQGYTRAVKQLGNQQPTNLGQLNRMRRTVTGRLADASAHSQVHKGGGLFGGVGVLGMFDPGHGGDSGPTKEDAARNRASIIVYRKQLAALTTVQNQWHQQSVDRAKLGGQQLAEGYGEAFNIYSRKSGIIKGMHMTTDEVVKRMGTLGPVGRQSLGQSMITWAREQAQMNPKLWGQAHDLTKRISAEMDHLGQHVKVVNGTILDGSQTQWKQIAAGITGPAVEAYNQTYHAFTGMQQVALGDLQMMGYSRSQATDLIHGIAAGGAAGRAASSLATAGAIAKGQGVNATGSTRGSLAPVGLGGKTHGATGMRIGGQGLYDNVMVAPGHVAAPGELIVNRHTESRLDRVLGMFGTSMGREVAGERTPHWRPMRPQDNGAPPNVGVQSGIWPGFARGGRLSYYSLGNRMGRETAGGVLKGASANSRLQAMVAEANAIDSKHFNYEWGGGHNGSFQPGHGFGHGSGPGVGYDCSGSVSAVLHAAGLLDSPLTSGSFMSWGLPGPGEVTLYASPSHVYMDMNGHYFGTSGANPGGGAGWFAGGPRPGFAVRHVPGIGAGAASGIDWRSAGALGAGPGAGGSAAAGRLLSALRAPNATTGGVEGALAQGSMNAIAAGMTARVNAGIRAGGGPGGGTGGLSGGTSGANQALGRRMMLAHGWGANQWPALKALWTRESGWNQNARNASSGAYGIPQALGHGNVFGSNPAAQIRWGLDYIAGRYGNPAGAWAHEQSAGWYEKGGRTPGWGGWFGQGGRARYRRPTMIGVGDAHVPEEVTVRQVRNTAGTNNAGGSGAHVHVHFHPGSIVVHGASKQAAEELADHVVARITTVLGGMGHENEGSVSD